MKSKLRAVAALSLLVAAMPAMAGEPYYFHKAGVAREAYMDDVAFCHELATGVKVQRAPAVYTPNMYAALAGAFFSGFMQGHQRRATGDAVERTCMADRGYARVEIDKESFKRVRQLDGEERLDALFMIAAAPTVLGKELPE